MSNLLIEMLMIFVVGALVIGAIISIFKKSPKKIKGPVDDIDDNQDIDHDNGYGSINIKP